MLIAYNLQGTKVTAYYLDHIILGSYTILFNILS